MLFGYLIMKVFVLGHTCLLDSSRMIILIKPKCLCVCVCGLKRDIMRKVRKIEISSFWEQVFITNGRVMGNIAKVDLFTVFYYRQHKSFGTIACKAQLNTEQQI